MFCLISCLSMQSTLCEKEQREKGGYFLRLDNLDIESWSPWTLVLFSWHKTVFRNVQRVAISPFSQVESHSSGGIITRASCFGCI